MKKNEFALNKTNFILLAVGMAIVILGFILMSGSGSTEEAFNPEIFSVRRIKVAPAVCFFGFCFIVFGIMYAPKKKNNPEEQQIEGEQGEETKAIEA